MIVSSALLLTDGEVVKGYRHWQAFTLTRAKRKTYKKAVQGFVTDTGAFLDRDQAARHAYRCRQVERRIAVRGHLMSEDLWPHDLPEWGTRPPLWSLWPVVAEGEGEK
jgi:hypothetical protein